MVLVAVKIEEESVHIFTVKGTNIVNQLTVKGVKLSKIGRRFLSIIFTRYGNRLFWRGSCDVVGRKNGIFGGKFGIINLLKSMIN